MIMSTSGSTKRFGSLFLVLLVSSRWFRAAGAAPQIKAEMASRWDEQLGRIESNQNFLRTKIMLWESRMEQVVHRLELIDSRLAQVNCGTANFPPASPSSSTDAYSQIPATFMAYDSIASKIDAMSFDLQTSIDDLHEKIFRLDERMGQHERQANQQAERLLSATSTNLEVLTSVRIDSATENRRHFRSLESKLSTFSTGIESRFQRLCVRPETSNQTGSQTNKSGPSRTKSSPSSRTVGHSKRNNDIQAEVNGRFADILDSLKPTGRTVTSRTLKSGIHRRTPPPNQREAVMDQSSSSSPVRESCCNCSSTVEESWRHFLSQQSSTLIHKLANMYEQLWNQGKSTADQLQQVAQTVNESKWHMDDGFRMIFSSYQTPGSNPITSPLPPHNLETVLKDIDVRMDLLEERTEGLLSEQAHCPNEWEGSQLIAEALERLVHFVGNKTQGMSEELAEVHHLVEKHHDQSLELISKLFQEEISKASLADRAETIAPERVPDEKSNTKAAENADEEDEKLPDAIMEVTDYTYVDTPEVE